MLDKRNMPPLGYALGDAIRQHGARGRRFQYVLIDAEPYQTKAGEASAVLTLARVLRDLRRRLHYPVRPAPRPAYANLPGSSWPME